MMRSLGACLIVMFVACGLLQANMASALSVSDSERTLAATDTTESVKGGVTVNWWLVDPLKDGSPQLVFLAEPSPEDLEVVNKYPGYIEFVVRKVDRSLSCEWLCYFSAGRKAEDLASDMREDTKELTQILREFTDNDDDVAITLLANQHLALAGLLSYVGDPAAQLHYSKSLNLLDEAVALGNKDAKFFYALTLQNGIGRASNPDAANQLYASVLKSKCVHQDNVGGGAVPSFRRMLLTADTLDQFEVAGRSSFYAGCDDLFGSHFFWPFAELKSLYGFHFSWRNAYTAFPAYYSLDRQLMEASNCGHILNSFNNSDPSAINQVEGEVGCRVELKKRFGEDFLRNQKQKIHERAKQGEFRAAEEALVHILEHDYSFEENQELVLTIAEFMAAENNIAAQLILQDHATVQMLAEKRHNVRWQGVSECWQKTQKLAGTTEVFDEFRKAVEVEYPRSNDSIEPLADPAYDNWYFNDEYHFRVHEDHAHRQIEIWVVVKQPVDCYLLGVEVNGLKIEPELVHNNWGLPTVAYPYRPKSFPKDGAPITATLTFMRDEKTTNKKSISFFFSPYYPPQ